jgi:Tol biopolymer transport system component
MKKLTIYLALILGMTFSLTTAISTPVQAQEDTLTGRETLDTILARAAANGFLVSLTRPELIGTMDFYLADSLDSGEFVSEFGTVTGYQIIQADWQTPGQTYQVEAVLQPSGQTVIIQTEKQNNRWRVANVEVISSAAAAAASGAVASAVRPVAGNGAGKLVFQTKNGGDIYVINADGTGLQQVTQGIDPQLSPDGTQITFSRWDPAYQLYTINVDGTNEQAWVGNKAQMKSPTWSADGARIIFSHLVELDPGGVEKFNPTTLVIRALRRGEFDVNIPSVPDNARSVEVNEDGSIEYVVPPDAKWHLSQIDLNKNEISDVVTGSSYNYAPVGYPTDANKLLYRGDRGLAIFDTQTQANQPVSYDGWDRGAISVSPDGSKIAFNYWQNGHWEIHTMNIDGTNRQRLTETPLSVIADNSRSEVIITEEGYKTLTRAQPDGQLNPNWNNAAPVWSPDGSQIAFVTDRTGKWEIWIMNADGSNQRPMFPNGALDDLEFDYAGVDERMLSWR